MAGQVLQTALARCPGVLAIDVPWPGVLDSLELGNGAGALSTPACLDYGEALQRLRHICELHHGRRVHGYTEISPETAAAMKSIIKTVEV